MNYVVALLVWHYFGNGSLLLLVVALVIASPVRSRRR